MNLLGQLMGSVWSFLQATSPCIFVGKENIDKESVLTWGELAFTYLEAESRVRISELSQLQFFYVYLLFHFTLK
jgi:hypothetical protein